jgi:Ca2+-binding RTX toxin-like protein
MLWNETSVQTRVAAVSCRPFANRSDRASGFGGYVPMFDGRAAPSATCAGPEFRGGGGVTMLQRRRVPRHALVMLGVLVSMAATSSAAHAATLSSTATGYRYVAAAGEANALRAWTDGRTLHLNDTGVSTFGTALPSGCITVPAELGIAADCDARGDQVLRIDLGDGNDILEAWELPRRVSLVVDAGSGENLVEGGSGDDRITGGADRDTLYGGPGDDLVVGGDGNDYVRGHSGDDVVKGGEGLNFIIGDGGDDELHGGSSFEYFIAGSGDDVVFGGGGADDIGLGRGDDVAFGGAGDDELRGGAGFDKLYGEGGNDLIRTRDGERDIVNCGGGADDVARVDADELDEAKRSCEKVKQADSMPAEPADVEGTTA